MELVFTFRPQSFESNYSFFLQPNWKKQVGKYASFALCLRYLLHSRAIIRPKCLQHERKHPSPLSPELSAVDEKSLCQTKKPLTVFVIFPRLPIELRLKIWTLSFPCGRTARLDLDTSTQRTPRDQLPPTLFANRESRSETLKHYPIAYPQEIFSYHP